MTFPQELVWQYGGPSQQSGNERQIPPDAHPQGFVGYPGAQCNYSNPAVAIGRTSQSLVVICETGVGRFYYKGVGLENGLSVERRHQSVKPLSHSTTTSQAARWRRIALAIARASMRMSRSWPLRSTR
jgi:hypothetical protein